jgi:hypothetical protein
VILGPADVTIAPPPESPWFAAGEEDEGASGLDPLSDIESWLSDESSVGPEEILGPEAFVNVESMFDEATWSGGAGDLEAEGVWDWVQSIGTGAATGAATGAVAGPWGALIGALAGGALGAAQQAAQPQAPASPTPARSSAAAQPARPPALPPKRATVATTARARPTRAPGATGAPAAPVTQAAATPAPSATDAGEVVKQLALLIPLVAQLATTFQGAGAQQSSESDDESALAAEEWEHQEALPSLEAGIDADEAVAAWTEADDPDEALAEDDAPAGDEIEDEATGLAIAAEWEQVEADDDGGTDDGDSASGSAVEVVSDRDPGDLGEPIDGLEPKPARWPETEWTAVEWDEPSPSEQAADGVGSDQNSVWG